MKNRIYVTLACTAIALSGFILTHTAAAPYQHNWWKAHRWASEYNHPTFQEVDIYEKCIDDNHRHYLEHPNEGHFIICVDPRILHHAFLQVVLRNGERAEFDICLEHGELRRIK